MIQVEWCLTCGKPTFRCFCRDTQPACDLGFIEEPERLKLREPPTSSNPADNGRGWRRKSRRGRQYVGVTRL